jgi:aspartyl-tRNA(Asn)/glutamyl-tRNA(Gln) amidotransferase subunit A
VTALEIAQGVRSGRLSAVDVARAALERARARGASLNAFITVTDTPALAAAARADARRAGPLAGVPVAIKDNICMDGLSPVEAGGGWGPTTCASRMLEGYRSPFTATAVRRLVDAGAVVIGKTNLDEFAMGGSGEHSAFGPTRNPFDPSRVPGGSSSGSAAAVGGADPVVPIALGSDTGGSVRQPAGWCGIYGMKPTYGRVSRWGLVAFASSLDQIGPMARTVPDLAAVLSVICGHDPADSTSAALPPEDFTTRLDEPVAGLRIGVPRRAGGAASGNHPAVAAALAGAEAALRAIGAEVVDVDLPHADLGIAAYYILATAEASSNLARYDGVRFGRRAATRAGEPLAALYARSRSEGFGAEVQRRILLGAHVLSAGYAAAYYERALRVRRLIKADFDAAFARAGCHALLMPSSPSPALRIGEKAGDPLALYLEDVYTVGVNLAGLPALTVPAGWADVGGPAPLPVGVQLIGPALAEGTLLRIARGLERHGPPARR